jgi:hypothetical protein
VASDRGSGLDERKWIYRAVDPLLVAGVFLLVAGWFPYRLIDDAYISFRYAHNLAHHGELVFNLGERTEGVTNLLWTVALGLASGFLAMPPDRVAVALSLSLLAFAVLRLLRLGCCLHSWRWGRVVAALTLVSSPHFMAAATNGLEAPLYTALLVEVVYRFCRAQFWGVYLAAGTLFLVRPDGFGPALLALGMVYAKTRRGSDLKTGVSVIGGMALGTTLFRLLYFGDLLPNSVVAKAFPLSLLPSLRWDIAVYFKTFFIENPVYSVLLASALPWLSSSAVRKQPTTAALVAVYCVGCILFSFAVAARNGGDWMPHHRLLLQYGALYSVLLLLLLQERVLPPRIAATLCLFSALSLAGFLVLQRHPRVVAAERNDFYPTVGERLDGRLAADEKVSAEVLGLISYRLIDAYVHDPLGLTDKYLARQGKPCARYGKLEPSHTLGEVRPAVAIWHRVGAVFGVKRSILDGYEAFCAQDCESWNAKVVMIRKDRAAELGPAFADWKKVVVGIEDFGPPPE